MPSAPLSVGMYLDVYIKILALQQFIFEIYLNVFEEFRHYCILI